MVFIERVYPLTQKNKILLHQNTPLEKLRLAMPGHIHILLMWSDIKLYYAMSFEANSNAFHPRLRQHFNYLPDETFKKHSGITDTELGIEECD